MNEIPVKQQSPEIFEALLFLGFFSFILDPNFKIQRFLENEEMQLRREC